MTGPPVSFAGVWRAGADACARLAGLGAVVIDSGPLTVVSSGAAARSGSVTAVLAGRVSDRRYLDAAVPSAGDVDTVTAIARAYAQLGPEAFALLRGEWAVVIWDAEREIAVVARDPLGARSVHYARRGSGALLAEDVRDVLALLPSTPAPDRRSVSSWLAYGVTADEATLYEGVSRLGPGRLLQLDGRSASTRPAWAAQYRTPDPRAADPARLRAAVDAAVARAAPAEQRAGVLLSGGLDSAIVAAAATASRRGHGTLACSATFPGDRGADEGELIDIVTRHLRLDALRSVVDWGRPLLGGLRYLATWRVPSTSPNTFLWLPLLTRAAEEGVELMLDGQGGDELFDQRPFYLFADLVARGRLLPAWRLTLRYPGVEPGVGRRHRARILRHFLRRGLTPLRLHRHLDRRRARLSAAEGLLSPADAMSAVEVLDQWAWLADEAPRWWAYRHASLVRVPQLLDAPGSLRRTAALAGLVDRHPLMLDQDLIGYALSVPPESSFDARFDRPIARASQAGRLPDAVRLRREKSGFSGVLTTSLERGDRDVLCTLLDPRSARAREFVAAERFEAKVDRLRSRDLVLREDEAAGTWQLATLECWLRQLEDPAFASELAARYDAPGLEHRIVRIPMTST